MMWKDVVRAAGVDVEPLAQQRRRHCRALDVPAGKPGPPGTVPRLQTLVGGRPPEGEVAWASFARIRLTPDPGQKLFPRRARQLPVPTEAGDVVINRPVDLVGMPQVDQPCDQLLHARD